MIVVDQMRGDYVDKFQGEWSGGLKRLMERRRVVPRRRLSLCGDGNLRGARDDFDRFVSHAAWHDRKLVVGPRLAKNGDLYRAIPNVKNMAYAGGTTKGGDSAWRMLMPSFAEELKYQTGGATRVVTFSLKARAAITMAGHKGGCGHLVRYPTGAWVTSSPMDTMPFVEDFRQKAPRGRGLRKDLDTVTARTPPICTMTKPWARPMWMAGPPAFPHPLKGKDESTRRMRHFTSSGRSVRSPIPI